MDHTQTSDFHTQTGEHGCVLEYYIQLTNIVGASPWFNQPHATDDDFVTRFATMAKTKLRPDVKAHNLKLLMYEGGPGLESSRNANATAKAMSFNRHDLMGDATCWVLGGLFNYFASTSLYSKYGSWGMVEHTGQDPYSSPKYLAVHRYIRDHFDNHKRGPVCSFVTDDAVLFGCYKDNTRQLHCGKSVDHGSHWTNYPTVPGNYSALILDGYDVTSHVVFVRSVDNLDVNKFYSLDTSKTGYKWNRLFEEK